MDDTGAILEGVSFKWVCYFRFHSAEKYSGWTIFVFQETWEIADT